MPTTDEPAGSGQPAPEAALPAERSQPDQPVSGQVQTVNVTDPTAPTGADAAELSFSEQIADQLGGIRGVVESCVPVLVFIAVNVATSLRPALIAAVGVAVAIGVFRLVQRQPVRHAVNGLFGIAMGGIIAWKTGQAKDFYLPGIFIAFGYAVLLLGSMALRRPVIGYVWGIVMARGRHGWRSDRHLLRTFQWLTLLWAGCFVLRGAVQGLLYWADQATLLGVSRIALSWPLYVAQLAITLWAVRRAARQSAAEPVPAGSV